MILCETYRFHLISKQVSRFNKTTQSWKLKVRFQGVCCWFNLPFKTGKFLAVENKVIILSGATTYS
jgi:hypothetical protein